MKSRLLRNLIYCLAYIFLSLSLFSCANNPNAIYSRVDEAVVRGDFHQGIAIMERDRRRFYRDPILYYLNRGMITHYADEYVDSIDLLFNAEQAIEAALTRSITREFATFIVNDNTREYAGEDYEDIYINVFNALNFYLLDNDIESALVEIRRMNEKLEFLSFRYGELISEMQMMALEKGGAVPANPSAGSQFSNSALARYLGMLFHRSDGNQDSALIDQNHLRVAFANFPQIYNHRIPSSIDEELNIPEGKARLNVIGFSGLSPIKEEQVIRIPLPNLRFARIALPIMIERPSRVSRVRVSVVGGSSFDLELLENMSAVARETFQNRLNVIYLTAVIRGFMKGATSSALGIAADNVDDGSVSLALQLLSIFTQIFAEASERADLRISRYFPGRAHVGGINLEPGVYSLNVSYYDVNGSLIASYDFNDIRVQEGNLNLVRAVCLR